MFRPSLSPPGLTTLVMLTGASVLAINMYLPTLADLAGDLSVSYAQASLSLSLFMILSAILQLVFGPIADRVGRRPVILFGFAVFSIASIGCALARDFQTFMVFRMIQTAVAVGATLPRAIVRDTSPPHEAAARLGKIGIAMALAPMLGPMLGGVLGSAYGWRSIFWGFAVMGLVMVWLTWTTVGETNTSPEKSIAAQFLKYPAVALDWGFWSYTLCMGFALGTFFVYVTGVPVIATEIFGLSPILVGAAIGLPPIGFMIGNTITARLGGKVFLSSMMIAGRSVTLAGLCGALLMWSAGVHHPLAFFGWMTAIGLGNGLTLPTASAGAMSVRPDMAGTASGLSGAFGILMGAVATAIAGAALGAVPTPGMLLALLFCFSIAGLIAAFPARSTERRLVHGA